jgi:hypothetical protein
MAKKGKKVPQAAAKGTDETPTQYSDQAAQKAAAVQPLTSGPNVTITFPPYDGYHVTGGAPLAKGTVDSPSTGMSAQIDTDSPHSVTDFSWTYQVLDSECPVSRTHRYLLTVQAWDNTDLGPPAYRWFYRDS